MQPLKARSVLKLKLGPPKPDATPPPPELHTFEIAGRARRDERRAAIEAMRRVLIQRWPDCFNFNGFGRPKKLLKVGIHRDIFSAAPELDPAAIKIALQSYVSDPTYRKAMVEGAARVDLDGNPAGAVTAAEAGWKSLKRQR